MNHRQQTKGSAERSSSHDVVELRRPFLKRAIGINFDEFSIKKMYLKIMFAKGQPFCSDLNVSTPKQLEMHECVISTIATDVLVLKKHAISIHSIDSIVIIPDQFQTKILHLQQTLETIELHFEENGPVV